MAQYLDLVIKFQRCDIIINKFIYKAVEQQRSTDRCLVSTSKGFVFVAHSGHHVELLVMLAV